MTAKEMFEALGYELKCDDTIYLIYQYFDFENGIIREVLFDKYSESHKISNFTRNNQIFPGLVNKKLYQSITKQIKELGWVK